MAARKPKTEEEKRRELQIAAQNRARKDAAREALQSNITNAPLFQATQKITESQPKYQQAAKKVEQKTGVKPTRVSGGNKSSSSSGSRYSGSSRSTGIPKNLRADTYDATMNRIQTAARTRANRLKELDTLTNNSVAWHFADAAGKEALRKANDAIRARYGLLFDEATGMTSTPEGENLSVEVPKIVEKERSYNEQTPLSVLGHNLGAGLAGINRGFYSTLDFLLPDFLTPDAVQDYINKAKTGSEDVQEKVREYNYSRGGTVGGVAGDLFQSAVGAVPQTVIALMSGGTSAAGQLAGASDDVVSAITRQLSNNSGYMSSFLSTVGTDYERAKANGASDTEAALSAILSSAATAGIETAGGIDVPAQSTSRLRNAARTVLEEGGEEVLQGATQRATQALYDPSVTLSDIADPASMAQDFGGGVLLGGVAGLTRRPAQANAETPLAGINEDIDVRNSWTQENSNALPTGEVPLLPAGTPAPQRTMYAGQTGVSSGRGNINTAPEAGVLYGGTRGRLYPTLPGRASSVTTPDVLYAAQNGQVSASLPTGLLPQGRSQQTRIGARVNSVDTYPVLAAVDDAGNTNGGLTNQQIGFVQELYNAQQKTGIPAREIANEIVEPAMQEYDAVLQSTEQYIRDYKGQGTVVVGTDEYGRGGYRSSQNDPWYSDFYAENGRAPRKSEAAGLAKTLVDGEIARGGGQFVTPEFAESYKVASDVQAAMEALGEDVLDVQATADGIQVSRGTPARTANLQDTNAGRAFVSPVTQSEPQSPLNTTPITPQLQTAQQAAGAAVNSRNIAPELRTAQPSVQRPATQRVQPTLQTASENVPQSSPESSVGAAQSNFDPYTHMANEYGTIDPGENPARIVDVPKSTDGTDRVNAGARTFMEAAVTTDEVVELLEREVASGNMSHDVIPDKPTMERAARRVTNTADLNAAVDDWTAQFVEGGQAPGKEDAAYGQALFAYFNKTGDNENAIKMASSLISQATRAGQVLQAQRMLKKLSPEGRVMSAVKIKQNIQNQLNEQYGDNAPQVELNDKLLNNLRTADNVDKAMKDIVQDIANQIPNTWMDKWNAWRYTSMLANIRTHVRNILGNTVFRPAIATKNKVGAVLETAADKTLRTFGKEGIERTKSITTNKADREFAKSEFEKLQSELEGSRYEQTSQDSLKRLKTNPFSGGVLERIGIGNFNLANGLNRLSNLNSGALDWEDTVAKKSVYVQSMAEYMKANGLTAKDMYNDLGGETDALLSAREYAKSEALKATFQDANALADLLTAMERKLGKPGQFIVGGLVPFKRTPANIIKRGVEYSPLGVLNGARKLFSKSSTIPEALDSIAAGLTGTGVLALGYALAERGWISVGDDENDKKQYFDEMQGKQSYAINFTWGDKEYSYTIDWAAPLALPLFVGVELNKFLKDDHPSIEDFTSALARITEPVFELTMLDGLNNAIEASGYGAGSGVTALAFSALTDYVTQGLAPTALGQVNRTFFDTTRRQTYPDPENNIPDSIEKVMQRTMQKIPGLSQRLTPYLDNFGREQQNGGFFENFLSPGYLEEITSTDAEKALDALYEATGDASVLPARPQKTYTIDGVEHNLTADQWLRLSNAKGQTALNAITALTQSGAYQSMSDQEKVNAVKDVYDYASAVSANQVYGKELEGTIKTVHDSGIDPGLYYAYKEMEDTLNETYEGYEARDQVFQTIRQDTSLTGEQKNQLYHTLLIKGTSDSQWEKYQEISDVVTAEEYVDAMIQYQAIKAYGDELEDGRAEAEATEFSYYLDSIGYDDAKRSALEDTFKYYKMFPADPTSYTFDMMRENGSQAERNNVDAIEASGVSAAQYMAIKALTKSAKWTEGEQGAKLAAHAKIVSENAENYEQYAAIMHAMDYKNIEDVYTGSGSLPNATAGTSQVARSSQSSGTGFVNPTKASNSVITSNYGSRNAPRTSQGYGSSNHGGIDIGGTGGNLNGQEADTIGGGIVTTVGYNPSGYGNYVIVDHGNGYRTLYGHLQKATVQQGQTVNAGQQIGVIGSTGNSQAPHLHLSAWYNDQEIDPATIIPGY